MKGGGGCRSIRVQDSNCASSLSCKPHACGYASWERRGEDVAYAGAKNSQAERTITTTTTSSMTHLQLSDNSHAHHTGQALPQASSTTHTSPPLFMPDAHSEPPVDVVRRDILLQLLPGKSFLSPL